MDDSDNSYAPSQSPDSAGSPIIPPKSKPATAGPSTSATLSRAANLSSTRPKRSLPVPSPDSSEDDRSFDFPVPKPQTIPSIDDLDDDPTLRSLWNFHDLHRSLDNNLNDILQASPLTPGHFDQSSVLHTLFFIKKVATIQCDSCDGKGRGEETYKCAQCVKQICRQCMEVFLAREAAAPDNDKDAFKWNWQGQYRHEGLKHCYIARKAAHTNGNYQVDIPVSLLGVDSQDTVTIHMIHGNNIDDSSPKISRRPRREPEVIDLTGDLPEPPPTKKTRTPKNASGKGAVESGRRRSVTKHDATKERTRLELSPSVSNTLDRIESAAAAANRRRRNRDTSVGDHTAEQTAIMDKKRKGSFSDEDDQPQQRPQRRQRQQYGQGYTTIVPQPPASQFAQPGTYNQTYNMQLGQPAAQATTNQTLHAAQRPGNNSQQVNNQAPATTQVPQPARGPARRTIFPPPQGSFLLVPNPNTLSGFEPLTWNEYQERMNRSQDAASSGPNNAAQTQGSTSQASSRPSAASDSGTARQSIQIAQQVAQDDPRNVFPRNSNATAAPDSTLYPIQTVPSGERRVIPLPMTRDPMRPFPSMATPPTSIAASIAPGVEGLNHWRYRDPMYDLEDALAPQQQQPAVGPRNQHREPKTEEEDDDQPVPDARGRRASYDGHADSPTRGPYPPPVVGPASPRLETINDVIRALSPSPVPAGPRAAAAVNDNETQLDDLVQTMPSGPISGGRQGQRGEDEVRDLERREELEAQARMRALLALMPETQELGLPDLSGEEGGEEGGDEGWRGG